MKLPRCRFNPARLLPLLAIGFAALLRLQAGPPVFLSDGLVAYYPFNGDAKDASGNGLDGTVLAGTALTTNRFGITNAAFRCRGGAEGVQISGPLFNTGQTGYTINMWFSTDNTAQLTQDIFTSFPSGRLAISYNHYLNPHRNLEFNIGTRLGWVGTAAKPYSFEGISTNFLAGEWHMVTFRKSEVNFDMYVDGILDRHLFLDAAIQGQFAWNNMTNMTEDVGAFIGSYGPLSPTEHLEGSIDDVRIYNRALSDAEIAALYDYESKPPVLEPRTAVATPVVVNGFVVGATLVDGGAGYTNAPAVAFVGGSGHGAAGTATVSNGVVTAIIVTNPGIGYAIAAPSIVVDPPPYPPTQATAEASVTNGFVTAIAVASGGHGYANTPPPVHLLRGGGTGATAVAVVNNGVVTGIVVTSAGSGYTNAPTVLIAAPPGYPRLGVEVGSVKVHVEAAPGYTYRIQTTVDGGATWTDTGDSFLAEQSTYTQVFAVSGASQLFRVVQVP